MEAQYIGKTRYFLKHNHKYEITIKKQLKSYVYDLTVWRDLTDEEEIDKVVNYASEISVKQNWNIKEIKLED